MTLTRNLARTLPVVLAAAATIVFVQGPAPAAAVDGTITSTGPLSVVSTTPDLNCAVNHVNDASPEFYGTTACATLVAIDGTLYGPADIPAGSSASPRTSWTAQGQSSSGAGTTVNPYRIVTVVSGGPLVVTQTDTYVVGDEAYGTRVAIENTSDQPKEVTLYRAGDCYLQDSDRGYGRSDADAGSVACTTGTDSGSRIEQWAPLTPGSHYFETGYAAVWSRIGSQLPFPDTSDDQVYQDNGAGLSWTQLIPAGSTASFGHITAFSPNGTTEVSDSDGDGFPDTWEQPDGGVDTNGDGTLDMKLSDFGATPDHPDVFVQVNWTETRSCVLLTWFCSTKNRRPSLAALADVQHAFAQHGVRLHVDAGPDSLMNPDNNSRWGSRSDVRGPTPAPARLNGWDTAAGVMDWSSFDSLVAGNHLLSSARSRIFHHALYVGSFDDAGHSGLSRSSDIGFASRDFILAYDEIQGGHPTRMQEAGTFMHELGHNLGLSHGGSIVDARANYKPNYPSVMNYFWQFSGTYKNSTLGLLDYSEGTLQDIDESALSESDGLSPDSAAGDIATMWSCPSGSARGPLPALRDVDWNCNGRIDSGTESANVTNISNNDDDLSVLADHDDWGSLVYDGGGALGGAGDPQSVTATSPTDSEPATAEDLAEVSPPSTAVVVSTPGQLAMTTGTTSAVDVIVANKQESSTTYQLNVVSNGVTLTGIPATVTLAPLETQTLSGALTAGAVSNDSYFEVDASAVDDASNSGAGVTEVFVVAGGVAGQPGVYADLDANAKAPGTLNATRGAVIRVSAKNKGPAGAFNPTIVVRVPKSLTVKNTHAGRVTLVGRWKVITWKSANLRSGSTLVKNFRLVVGKSKLKQVRLIVRTQSSTLDSKSSNNQVVKALRVQR